MARKASGQRGTPDKGRSTGQHGSQKATRSIRNHSVARKPRNLPERSFEARNRALNAIALMRREGVSLKVAARSEETSPKTILKYLPKALSQSDTGHWIVRKTDPYIRYLVLPGPYGAQIVRASNSEEARLASAYLKSIARWAKNGRLSELEPFIGKRIGEFELVTSPHTLGALRDAGLLHLDSLYAALRDVAA